MTGLQLQRRGMISESGWNALRYWHSLNGRHELPWRSCLTPWRVFVAETLLHRTRAENVAGVYSEIIKEFPSPSSVVSGRERWLDMTLPLGLEWRSTTFVDACEILVRDFGGVLPEETRDPMSLPGVGRYIADAVRCFGFGAPVVLVDTNTIRLASRIAGVSADPQRHRTAEIRELVGQLAEPGYPPSAADNFALLDLAALVCLPRQPVCQRCPVRGDCATGRDKCLVSDVVDSSIPDDGQQG